jgi:hypothetical protein
MAPNSRDRSLNGGALLPAVTLVTCNSYTGTLDRLAAGPEVSNTLKIIGLDEIHVLPVGGLRENGQSLNRIPEISIPKTVLPLCWLELMAGDQQGPKSNRLRHFAQLGEQGTH